MNEELQAIENLLTAPGEPFKFGIKEDEAEKYIQIAMAEYGYKPYCVIKNWVIWDLVVTEEETKTFSAMNIQPHYLHAKFVIYDSTWMTKEGDYRISTPLVTLHEPCFFVTRNTVYICIGGGTRKAASREQVMSFFY